MANAASKGSKAQKLSERIDFYYFLGISFYVQSCRILRVIWVFLGGGAGGGVAF